MKKGILGALPIVAAAYSEKFGIPVNVGGDRAYTDGKVIQIPSIRKDYQNMDVAWGYLAHEAAHIKWSDFDSPPSTPFEHELVNSLEDCRIEAAMIQKYPGTVTTLGALDEFLIANGSHQAPDSSWHPGQVVITVCLYWGMINVVGKRMFEPLMAPAYSVLCQQAGENFGRHLVSLLNVHLPSATSTADIRALASAIIKLMKDECQDRDQNGADQGSSSSMGQPDSENPPQAAEQPNDGQQDGQTKLDEGASQSEGSDVGQEQGGQDQQGDTHASADPGQVASDQASDSGEPSQGGQDVEPSFQAGQESQQRTPTQTQQGDKGSKDWAQQALAADKGDLQQDRMKSIRQELEAHEDPNAQYLTVRSAPETTKNEWQGSVLRRASARVGTRLQHELMGLVQSKALTAKRARSTGKRLDTSRVLRVMSGDPRVFRTPAEKTSPNTAVHLLVDVSASMSKNERLETAQTAAMALATALDGIKGVNAGVSFFGGIAADPVRSAMRHGQKAATRSAYFGPVAGGSTPMAEAIWYAAYALSKTRENRKMIMVITDGEPNNKPATKAAITLAEESGMEVIGIGIETLINSRLFNRHIVINRVEDLCQSLFGLMGDYLTSEMVA